MKNNMALSKEQKLILTCLKEMMAKNPALEKLV